MPSGVTSRTDRLLIKLDRQYGLDAVYHTFGEPTIDEETGDVSTLDAEIPVRVRSSGFNSFDISQLQSAGLGQVDAVWLMRSAYLESVESGDVISVSGFDYNVIDQGATLDSLGLLWTILTRRRRTA